MNVVLDTGYFLLISSLIGRRASAAQAFARAAVRLGFTLHMSAPAWLECASHTAHALPAAPSSIWLHSDQLVFLRRFPTAVRIDRPEASVFVDVAVLFREGRDLAGRRRRGASYADAATAELVRRLDAQLLVTSDRADFERLLPAYDGEVWSPQELVRALGG